MTSRITIIGIGEDGLKSLSAECKTLIQNAKLLVGGRRHLEKIQNSNAEKIEWGKNLLGTVKKLKNERKEGVVILASGDPMDFGIGTTLLKFFSPREIIVIPNKSAFSLVASKMRWPLSDLTKLSLHGRSIDNIHSYIVPDARLLVLSWDGSTPRKISDYLLSIGFGNSQINVFEHLGGELERITTRSAKNWLLEKVADLNTVAIECKAGPNAVYWSRAPGLPEAAFEHDGKITKREIRAATIAALEPLPGKTLWDVGSGSGSISIEWLRLEPLSKAIAVEQNSQKCDVIKRNASKLGVPRLKIICATAPYSFSDIGEKPNSIFVGGGLAKFSLLTSCWDQLVKRGLMVANAVSIEAQKNLIDFNFKFGGELTSISVSRSGPVGNLTALRPMMNILQLKVKKQ